MGGKWQVCQAPQAHRRATVILITAILVSDVYIVYMGFIWVDSDRGGWRVAWRTRRARGKGASEAGAQGR